MSESKRAPALLSGSGYWYKAKGAGQPMLELCGTLQQAEELMRVHSYYKESQLEPVYIEWRVAVPRKPEARR
jgi:hypothetical protein